MGFWRRLSFFATISLMLCSFLTVALSQNAFATTDDPDEDPPLFSGYKLEFDNPMCDTYMFLFWQSYYSPPLAIATVSAQAVISQISNDRAKEDQTCGSDWVKYDAKSNKEEEGVYKTKFKSDDFRNTINNCIASTDENYRKSDSCKVYREFIHGGMEYKDVGPDACKDGNDPLKYYYRGFTGNDFNCTSLLVRGAIPSDPKKLAAYNCCIDRAANSMCIERVNRTNPQYNTYSICKRGNGCVNDTVTYSVFDSDKVTNALCAKTYSLCPHNTNLGRGNDKCLAYTGTNKTLIGTCTNAAHYLKHCAMTNDNSYIYISNLNSPFFSSACVDFKGDSRNGLGNQIEADFTLIGETYKGFTAPIAQCVTETILNMFLNRAGHDKCFSTMNSDGTCSDSNYLYHKGDILPTPSFFSVVQERFRFLVILVVTLSITIYGAKTLLTQEIKKAELMMQLVKIMMVFYFSIGDAWQSLFFEYLIKGSQSLSSMMMQIYTPSAVEYQDGCQFTQSSYPSGSGYLATWDTIDCKIALYLGYGPGMNVPNLAVLIVAGMFTGGLGVVFIMISLSMAIFVISFAVRALHVFILSVLGMVIMVYVSPIVIPMVLFARTKAIFDTWLKQLIGFALQPMILFTFLAFSLSIFDSATHGSAKFTGTGGQKAKIIDCSPSTIVNGVESKAVNDSLICILTGGSSLGSGGGALGYLDMLLPIGIAIPFLNFSDIPAKLMTLLKGAFVFYLLMTMLDKVSEIASTLIGGTMIKSTSPSAMKMGTELAGNIRGVQQRAVGGIQKLAGKASNKVSKLNEDGKNADTEGGKGEGGSGG